MEYTFFIPSMGVDIYHVEADSIDKALVKMRNEGKALEHFYCCSDPCGIDYAYESWMAVDEDRNEYQFNDDGDATITPPKEEEAVETEKDPSEVN